MTDQLLTVPEVMDRLHLSRAKVYDLIRAQHLASLKIRGARRIPEAALTALRTHIPYPEEP
jgi:excisionase family DNA binding protein